jgi:hypothetical protein
MISERLGEKASGSSLELKGNAGSLGDGGAGSSSANKPAAVFCNWRACLSAGDRMAAAVPRWVGSREGMPTGLPQAGHIVRRAAILSLAFRRLPQEQKNLIDITAPAMNSKMP